MRIFATIILVLTIGAGSALSQTQSKLPCDYRGALLRRPDGSIVRYTSDEMKANALQKYDISGAIKQADIKGTVVLDILVGADGHVICTKAIGGHPMIDKPVEEALRKWLFKRQNVNGEPVGYTGWMEFSLCNISCGESGPSMTILR